MTDSSAFCPLLTPRLQAIADLVPPGSRLADVGTDHAYIPVYLTAKGICPTAIAGDIVPGPLDNARRTVEKYGVSDKVTTLLSPGLEAFPPRCADAVVIAGMGGDQIADIVAAASWLCHPEVTLLLQPMSMQEKCRTALHRLSFACEKEVWVEEGRHCYVVMVYRFSLKELPPLSHLTAFVGSAPGQDDPAAKRYLHNRTDKLRRMIEGMSRSPRLQEERDRQLALLRQVEAYL